MTNDEPAALAEEGPDPWDLPADVLLEEPDIPVRIYDLEERTAKLGEAVIDLCALIPLGPRTNRLIDQITGCGTSIGGNYGESDDALSERDFSKSIGICRKEARESKHFIRMMARACPAHKPALRRLWLEARELHLIFSKIWRTTRRNIDKPKPCPPSSPAFVIRHSSFELRHSHVHLRAPHRHRRPPHLPPGRA